MAPQIADATVKLFDYARENDVVTIMGMSSPSSWNQELLKKLYNELVPRTDWMFLNKRELYVLGGKHDSKTPKEKIESYMTPERSLEYGRILIKKRS